MMGADRPVYTIYFFTFLSLWIYCTRLIEGNISDACHGLGHVNQTYNILECEAGSKICITEVRYYQWHPSNGCPYELSSVVREECCHHNASLCSWEKTVLDEIEEFEKNCSTSGNPCKLHSSHAEKITENECDVRISPVSSVRSISYLCVEGETCSKEQNGSTDAETTPSPNDQVTEDVPVTAVTRRNEQEQNMTGAIAGGVVGSLVGIGVAVTIIILLKRRSTKSQARKSSPGYTANNFDTRPAIRLKEDYATVDSFYQPETAAKSDSNELNGKAVSPLDRTEPLRLNKNKVNGDNSNGPVFSVQTPATPSGHVYDRVQGEVAHFKLHGDYDHVVGLSDVTESSDVIPFRGIDNAGGDLTYDQLHRGQVVTRAPVTEVDPYDVLNKSKTNVT